jgi:hypothetical protein
MMVAQDKTVSRPDNAMPQALITIVEYVFVMMRMRDAVRPIMIDNRAVPDRPETVQARS